MELLDRAGDSQGQKYVICSTKYLLGKESLMEFFFKF